MLEFVSPQPSGQAISRNDFRNAQQDEDPDEIESSTGTGEDDQHVEDMLSGEEPQLEEEESAIQIPPLSDGSLPPKPGGCNHQNQIMEKLDDLAAQLQRLCEISVPVGLRHHRKPIEELTFQTCKPGGS